MMKTSNRSVVIVGAGVAGLSAGCYARMNGYEATIFESHHLAGGYAAMYRRKGYVFDIALDWLSGIDDRETDSLMWRELGFLRNRKIAHFDKLLCIRDRDGQTLSLWTDPVLLEHELLQLTEYEEDAQIIRQLCSDIASLSEAPAITPIEPNAYMGPRNMLELAFKFLPYARIFTRYTSSTRDFAEQLRSPRLREIMRHAYLDPAMPQSMFTTIYQLSGMRRKSVGFPQGGGHGLAEHLAALFTQLGGTIHYQAPVGTILVQNGKAIGVQVQGGEQHHADHVITACDTRAVVYKMLQGRFVDDAMERAFAQERAYPSLLRVYLGVAQDSSGEPHTCVHLLDEALDIPGLFEGHEQRSLVVRHDCQLDASFAPPGKSIVSSIFFADYDYWKNLHDRNRKQYHAEKRHVAEVVMSALERIHPGIRDKIEYVEVVTPAAYGRYAGNHLGAIEAWIDGASNRTAVLEQAGVTLSGLDGLYMIGDWVAYGGMSRAVAAGRHAITTLCKQDEQCFRTEISEQIFTELNKARLDQQASALLIQALSTASKHRRIGRAHYV